MSTGPVDSVFRFAEPPHAAYLDTPISDTAVPGATAPVAGTPTPDPQLEWANSELHTIASTIEELQGRLQQANARLNSLSRVEATEYEIGRLFVEAQRFSEESLSRLDLQVHEILREAEEKARQILAEATEEAQQLRRQAQAEAQEIRRQAQGSAFVSPKTAQDLQSAISGFTAVNNRLIKELGVLNAILAPTNGRGATESDPSSTRPWAPERDHPIAYGARHSASTEVA